MKNSRALSALFLFLSSFPLFCQTGTFEPGSYLTTEGDRVAGYLLREDDRTIARRVYFQTSANSGPTTVLSPTTTAEVLFTSDSLIYRPVEFSYFNDEKERLVEDRFARVLLDGSASLLYLDLPNNTFTRLTNEPIQQLFYAAVNGEVYKLEKITTRSGASLFEDDRYRPVLKTALSGSGLDREIDRVVYTPESLSRLLSRYNQRSGDANTVVKEPKIRYHAAVGGYFTPLFLGDEEINGFNGGATLQFLVRPTAFPQLMAGASYSVGSSRVLVPTESTNGDLIYEGTTQTIPLIIGYEPSPTQDFSPIVALRFTRVFSHYRVQGLFPGTTTIMRRESEGAFGVEAGVRFKRIYATLRYEKAAAFAEGSALSISLLYGLKSF